MYTQNWFFASFLQKSTQWRTKGIASFANANFWPNNLHPAPFADWIVVQIAHLVVIFANDKFANNVSNHVTDAQWACVNVVTMNAIQKYSWHINCKNWKSLLPKLKIILKQCNLAARTQGGRGTPKSDFLHLLHKFTHNGKSKELHLLQNQHFGRTSYIMRCLQTVYLSRLHI